MELITRSAFDLNRKVKAGGITGIVTVALVAALDAWVPGVGQALSPVVTALVGVGATFIGSYLFRERKTQ